MHFDKKSADFNEEHYISCILEEEGVEIPSSIQIAQDSSNVVAATAAAATASAATTTHQQTSQLIYCDKCNYSSSYKGNVVSKFVFFLLGLVYLFVAVRFSFFLLKMILVNRRKFVSLKFSIKT